MGSEPILVIWTHKRSTP